MPSVMRVLGQGLAWVLRLLVILPLGLWCTTAIYFSNLPGSALRTGAAALFVVGAVAAFSLLRNRVRTFRWFLVAGVGVIFWWVLIPASNERNWTEDMQVPARFALAGDTITVQHVRNLDWTGAYEFTPRYEDRTYSLEALSSLDLALCDWGEEGVAHTIVSFGFDGGEHLCVSIETRREADEPQTGLRGLFKQYEMMYVVADERDVLRVRTQFRGENVYLYPLRLSKEDLRVFFLDVMERVEDLAEHPAWYNTIVQNCTTAFLPHRQKIRPWRLRDIRVLLNGKFDELLYDNGSIRTDLPFAEARAMHRINQYLVDEPDPANFSQVIRPWDS